jgi:hypothetical protein
MERRYGARAPDINTRDRKKSGKKFHLGRPKVAFGQARVMDVLPHERGAPGRTKHR